MEAAADAGGGQGKGCGWDKCCRFASSRRKLPNVHNFEFPPNSKFLLPPIFRCYPVLQCYRETPPPPWALAPASGWVSRYPPPHPPTQQPESSLTTTLGTKIHEKKNAKKKNKKKNQFSVRIRKAIGAVSPRTPHTLAATIMGAKL